MSQTLLFDTPEAPARAERIFLGWSEPFLPRAAAELVGRYAGDGEARMERLVVVVPGARAGRRLKELLLLEAERAGLRLVPPRVVTTGGLPELLYEAELPPASGALGRRAWALSLRDLRPRELAALTAAPPAHDDLVGWTRFAAVIEALHRDVCGAGLRFSDVAARCGEGLLYADDARWSVLSRVQESYESTLRRIGAGDVGLARIAAVEAGGVSLDGELWLAGVAELPLVVRRMLERLAAGATPVRALVHAPPAEADSFDELGCVAPAAWAERPVPLDDDRLTVCGRPADQAEEAVRALAALDGGFSADEIVVAVPDEQVLPELEQKLGTAGVPVRRAAGAPAERARAMRLLAAVADFVDGRRYDALAALARHPDLWRWIRRSAAGKGSPGEWIDRLDDYFCTRLPAHVPRGAVEGTGSSAAAVGALCRALDDPRLLGRLEGRRRLAEWMPEIVGLLEEVYASEELDRRIPEHRELAELAAIVKGAAAELYRLPPALDEGCDAATAVRLLLEAVRGQAIPPAADEPAVELLGWLEIHLDDSPVAVVTGFNEGILPESVNADAFLPNSLRTRLGLVDNEARYARDAYHLTAVLRSRAHVRVIAGRSTVRGDPLRPSRLMFAVEGPALAWRVRRFYSGSGGEPTAAAPPPSAKSEAEPASRFQLPPEPVLRAPQGGFGEISVSAFGRVLASPYVFALESVLGLRDRDDAARELDGRGFGKLAHLVLERFGRSGAAGSGEREEVRAALEAELDRCAQERFGRDPLPAVRLQVEQLRVRLRAFAAWHADWIRQGWRVMAVEASVSGVPFEVDGEPILLHGRIDRIDHHPERGWAVFDYKTGDKGETPEATHRKGRGAAREWKDLQLPLYRHLLPHVTDADGAPLLRQGAAAEVRLGYLLLPRDSERVSECFADWSAADLDEADECARSVVRFLREGVFRHDPDAALPRLSGPLASLLGAGYLRAAEDADPSGEPSDA